MKHYTVRERLLGSAAFGVCGAFALVAFPNQARAGCTVGAVTVQCGTTSTTDTTFPGNVPNDRNYSGLLPIPIIVTVDPGTTVSGNGLAFSNTGTGGVTVT